MPEEQKNESSERFFDLEQETSTLLEAFVEGRYVTAAQLRKLVLCVRDLSQGLDKLMKRIDQLEKARTEDHSPPVERPIYESKQLFPRKIFSVSYKNQPITVAPIPLRAEDRSLLEDVWSDDQAIGCEGKISIQGMRPNWTISALQEGQVKLCFRCENEEKVHESVVEVARCQLDGFSELFHLSEGEERAFIFEPNQQLITYRNEYLPNLNFRKASDSLGERSFHVDQIPKNISEHSILILFLYRPLTNRNFSIRLGFGERSYSCEISLNYKGDDRYHILSIPLKDGDESLTQCSYIGASLLACKVV